MLKKINKKGLFLESKVLNIILAVIGMVILAMLAYKLFSIYSTKSDIEQAKSTLNAIVEKLNSLEEGDETDFLLASPKGWCLILYSDSKRATYDFTYFPPPSNFYFNDLLCMCEKRGTDYYFYLECEEKGACVDVTRLKIFPSRIITSSILNTGPAECISPINELILSKKDEYVHIETTVGESVVPKEFSSGEELFSLLLDYKPTIAPTRNIKDPETTVKDKIVKRIKENDFSSFYHSTFAFDSVSFFEQDYAIVSDLVLYYKTPSGKFFEKENDFFSPETYRGESGKILRDNLDQQKFLEETIYVDEEGIEWILKFRYLPDNYYN